ncbi:Glycosyltransferase, GT2 family [Nocardioides alpinus]|uniref:Glycosyltransferase family 2 protein n=1 Tax=Nocardioides alpinus TaxID=748909 RepID=A0A1I1AIK0_9ACTN|nr:galactosyltransferase-related protein [Nocardioides alpinus]PKH41781.1 glycosyltransferase family 2 protein [Nocardioides alpinus]SFB37849.1 Glycosyltransferase, GT2 family [Nocardioides alpinus]
MSGTAVVTVVHRRHEHLSRQRATLAGSSAAVDHVVVAMDDPELAAQDWCTASLPRHSQGLPLAAARNRGAEVALDRGSDVLVFLDVDCLADPLLVEAYADVVRDEPATIWSGPVTYLEPPPADGYDLSALAGLDSPHPARPAPARGERLDGADPDLFWSLSFACSAEAWRRTGGFCEDYVGYGGEDTDFARIAVAAGLDLGWVGAARAFHQWHPVSRPPTEHVDDIVRNAEIFRGRWGDSPMLGWLEAFEERGLVGRDVDGRWQVVSRG